MKYPPWVVVDAVERYLDGLYDFCVQTCGGADPPKEEQEGDPTASDISFAIIPLAGPFTAAYEEPGAIFGKSDVQPGRRELEMQIVTALNVARRNPHHFIPIVSLRKPKEGKSLTENTADFLRKVAQQPRDLRVNPSLSATCEEAIRLLGADRARHTASFSLFMQSCGSCSGVVGEMFWASSRKPFSGFDVVADFLVDDGNPERSHRMGIFDNDFREVGVRVTQTPFGEFVVFLHFADRFCLWGANSDDAKMEGNAQWAPELALTKTGDIRDVPKGAQKRSTGDAELSVGMTKETREAEAPAGFIDLTSSPESGNSPKRPRIQQGNRLTCARVKEEADEATACDRMPGNTEQDEPGDEVGCFKTRHEEHGREQIPGKSPSPLIRDEAPSSPLRDSPRETCLRYAGPDDVRIHESAGLRERWYTPLPTTPSLAEGAAAFPKEPSQTARQRTNSQGRFAEEFVGVSALGLRSARRGAPSGDENRSDEGEVPCDLPNAAARGATPMNPLGVAEAILEKIQRFATEPQWRQEGIAPALLSSTEEKLVRCAPQLFGIIIEPVSSALLLRGTEEERDAYRGIMELFESGHEWEIAASDLRETREKHGVHVGAVLDRLLDAGEISDLGEDFQLISPPRTSFPWRPQTRPIPPPVLRSSGQHAPERPPAAMDESIPNAISSAESLPELATPLRVFSSGRRNHTKSDVIFQWLRGVQSDITNSPKMMAEIMWLFFDSEDEDSQRILYSGTHGWMVYDGVSVRDEPRLLRGTQLLQGPFLDCIVSVIRANRRRNIWRNTEERRHPRAEFLLELQKKLGNHTSVQHLMGEARPYFLRSVGFDLDPLVLQLQNAVVDLRCNCIRGSRASDYTSKKSQVRAPDGALGSPGGQVESAEDSEARKWAWDLLWSISKKGETSGCDALDREEKLGEQDLRNFNYLLLLFARLLEGRPLKKVIYVFSPRGRNSKRSIEELLRQLLGDYMATCKHSIFLADRGADESNSSVSLSREGVRVLFGQEVDRKQKWSNAMLKRRADCGREGGTLKHSNVFHEYDPVYTPLFGCNEPFLLESPPGNSEKDRTLILYLPNKFCDDAEMDEEPKSPRRFPKAELDTMLREPRCGWGLLLILLRLRRRTSDLDKSVNEGTPTSSYWRKVWFPKTGLQFQRECTYKNQFGAMEVEEAVAHFRAWFATAPLATYEYQTLPVKEIRSVLTRTFGESSYDGATEIIAGWSLRPSDGKAYCGSYSRVGMVKERAASHPSEGQRRNSDGTFTEEDYRKATLDYNSLPRTPRQVAKHWQKYGILPQEAEGGRLEIRMTRMYGDKANGGLALCATRGPDKNRHYVYTSIRPQLLWQSKLPLVEVNRLLFDLSWDLSNTQIAARRGWLKFSEKPKRVRRQPITHLRRVMQMVVAYSEEKRFENILLGGRGAEVEADATKLGRSRKSGVGRLGYNEAYVQFVGERGGTFT